MQSPCNACEHHKKGRDKNHPDCVDCDLRVKYAVKQNMLHPEVLEQKEDPLVLEAREMVPVRKEKKRKTNAKRLRFDLYFGQAREILDEIEKIAKIEMRTKSQQALYFIKEGIEKWKGEHNSEE